MMYNYQINTSSYKHLVQKPIFSNFYQSVPKDIPQKFHIINPRCLKLQHTSFREKMNVFLRIIFKFIILIVSKEFCCCFRFAKQRARTCRGFPEWIYNINSQDERSPVDSINYHNRKAKGPLSSMWAMFLGRIPNQQRKGSFVRN